MEQQQRKPSEIIQDAFRLRTVAQRDVDLCDARIREFVTLSLVREYLKATGSLDYPSWIEEINLNATTIAVHYGGNLMGGSYYGQANLPICLVDMDKAEREEEFRRIAEDFRMQQKKKEELEAQRKKEEKTIKELSELERLTRKHGIHQIY
jgi:hypothetical protein